ncbi:hypothetical protein DPMN_172360 [Dreissena polymorpha]|uniref:Uncharacterized protein n=1 Tax=Dreissena polymorpha TaxID=45954 RepID=A0A9D4E2Z6_DREPO|nr:hypothetical protein DPMN_172360 [Dreissena polymorpha]
MSSCTVTSQSCTSYWNIFLKCDSSLYVNFINYENAFERIDQKSQLRYYRVPVKIIASSASLIK